MRLRVAFVCAASLVPGQALAHAILVGSDPPLNGTVSAGHDTITLRYNSRIDRGRSRVTVTGPDGQAVRLPIAADGPPEVMTMQAELTPGDWTLRWQVLAVDGHITRGDVPFTVKAP